MKAIWKAKNGYRVLNFGNYYVKKESDSFYGVYDEFTNLITSATTLTNASKKAKLLQIGFLEAIGRYE